MADPLRLLIVDDEVLQRRRLVDLAGGVEGAEAVDTAASGAIALSKIRRQDIDLVLLDADAADTTETIRAMGKEHPDVGVVLLADGCAPDTERVVEALEDGGLEVLLKPCGEEDAAGCREFQRRLAMVLRFQGARANVRRTRRATQMIPRQSTDSVHILAKEKPVALPTGRVTGRIDLVAIGISTGGPNALNEMLPALPGDLGVPVVMVQHMPAAFTKALAANLNEKCALRVVEAAEGEELAPNTVYIAPGGRHMVVEPVPGTTGLGGRFRIGLNDDPPVQSCRPAADVLFRSLAAAYTGRVLAVVMTGMGYDGRDGVQALKERGRTVCLSQTADTCTVYGMPRAVDEAGLSDEKVALANLAGRITAIVKKN